VSDHLNLFCNYVPPGVMHPAIKYAVSELYCSDLITKRTEHLVGLVRLYCRLYWSRDKDI